MGIFRQYQVLVLYLVGALALTVAAVFIVNNYRLSPFKPCELGFQSLKKEITLSSLPIEGFLPSWLNGALLRIGPGQFEIGSCRATHLMDGLAMVHEFRVNQGTVAYKNRFLKGGYYAYAQAQHSLPPKNWSKTAPRRYLAT